MRLILDVLLRKGIAHSTMMITIGLVFGAFAIWHECRWRRRLRTWIAAEGVVVESKIIDGSSYSEIEFEFSGTRKRFTPDYSDNNPAVGSRILIIFNPETGKAERFDFSSRWIFTLGPGSLSTLFLWFGLTG